MVSNNTNLSDNSIKFRKSYFPVLTISEVKKIRKFQCYNVATHVQNHI